MQLKRDNFIYDEKINVWRLPRGAEKFDYADGGENRLFEKISACADKSVYSEELLPYKDWPEEYHLSPVRCNVLIPLRDFIGSKKKIFELGCGCGSITRYLGEQGHDVTAVEGSIDRARVVGARCRDLPNVRVYCSDFQHVDFTDEKFDIITLIGVFEYAALYWKTEAPYKACLQFVNRHCCEKTSFILAIENQLGIKYLNGMPEDHAGQPFFGINDLYQAETPSAQTFTKKELSRLVMETLAPKYYEFLGLFPDYKLPSVLLTEGAFEDEMLNAPQIISSAKSRAYLPIHFPLFHEPSLFKVLQKEGIAFSFVNSFLLLASKNERKPFDWLVKVVSNNRRRQYNTETTIKRADGPLRVEKRRIFETASKDQRFSFEISPSSEFHSGELLSFELERTMLFTKKRAWERLREQLVEWALFLKENCSFGCKLSGDWYDAVPRNIMRCGGNLRYFDREWRLPGVIDIRVVIIRGVLDTFSSANRAAWLLKVPHKTLRSVVVDVCKAAGLSVEERHFKAAWDTEATVYSGVYPGKDYAACYNANKKLMGANLSLQRLAFSVMQKSKKALPWGVRQAKRLRGYFRRAIGE